ncbi:50S ribosomal protein L7 serine acetyltransferase [Prolixibacter bellariivorans]|uniref:50S ribosomal protein L7 serine acetyltransferase n=1 Tax=Prolixibacter bellariivorans TaxID=314319 RepID=A0A5M4AYZ3_9BACT|nr:GNAT family protein [Prolixibacter bellariivorans]GET32938.1 50S ribosomal protein L7 serine acetyltransferase [Prolixibacter bellariivorans]
MSRISIRPGFYLESLGMEHADIVFEAIDNNREHLSKWLPFVSFTRKPEDTEEFISAVVNKKPHEKEEVFTIWYEEEFAGLIGYVNTDRVNRKTEIGYWLLKSKEGKGIITQSTRQLIKLSFKRLQMNRITIRCAVGNTRSSAVPKRLGFTFEGIERQGEKHDELYFDLEIFSLLKSEWKKQA